MKLKKCLRRKFKKCLQWAAISTAVSSALMGMVANPIAGIMAGIASSLPLLFVNLAYESLFSRLAAHPNTMALVVKCAVWRLIASSISGGVVWLLQGDLNAGLVVAGVEALVLSVLYLAFEYFWLPRKRAEIKSAKS